MSISGASVQKKAVSIIWPIKVLHVPDAQMSGKDWMISRSVLYSGLQNIFGVLNKILVNNPYSHHTRGTSTYRYDEVSSDKKINQSHGMDHSDHTVEMERMIIIH